MQQMTFIYWSYKVGVIALMKKLTILLMSSLLGPDLFLSSLFLSICNLYLGEWIRASSRREDGAYLSEMGSFPFIIVSRLALGAHSNSIGTV